MLLSLPFARRVVVCLSLVIINIAFALPASLALSLPWSWWRYPLSCTLAVCECYGVHGYGLPCHPLFVLIDPCIEIHNVAPHLLSRLHNRKLTAPYQTPQAIHTPPEVVSRRVQVIQPRLNSRLILITLWITNPLRLFISCYFRCFRHCVTTL